MPAGRLDLPGDAGIEHRPPSRQAFDQLGDKALRHQEAAGGVGAGRLRAALPLGLAHPHRRKRLALLRHQIGRPKPQIGAERGFHGDLFAARRGRIERAVLAGRTPRIAALERGLERGELLLLLRPPLEAVVLRHDAVVLGLDLFGARLWRVVFDLFVFRTSVGD